MTWLLALAMARDPLPAPAATPPGRPDFPALEEHRLRGGTPVLVASRDRLPLAQIDLALAADLSEVEDAELLAILAGRLLGTDTRDRDANAWKSAMESLGARADFHVTQNRLEARLRVPQGNEADALALLAEALRRPAFSPKAARIVLEAWRIHRLNLEYRIHSVHERGLNHAFFPTGHSLRQEGLPEDLARLTAERAEHLVALLLETGGASFSVAGVVEPETLLPLLEQHFGDLEGEGRPPPYEPVPAQGGRWVVDRTGFDIARVTVAVAGPPAGHEDEAALRVLTNVLAGTFDSRMSLDLRERQGLTYGVHGDMKALPGLGMIRVDLDTPLHQVGDALVAAEAHLDAVEREGVSQEEVDRARAHLMLDHAQTYARLESVAEQLMLAQVWSLPLSVWDEDLDALEAVTPADVVIAARKWLVPEHRTWVVTGAGDWIQHDLERVGRPATHTISAADLSAER